MFCSRCGNKLDDTAVFCSACGNKITDNQSETEQRHSAYKQQNVQYTANQAQPQYTYGQRASYSYTQSVPINYQTVQVSYGNSPLEELRKKLQVDMIIWITIASVQVFMALYCFVGGMTLSSFYLGDFSGNYYINGILLAIVAVLNFFSAYKTSCMRSRIAAEPTGIVGEYESVAPYVVNLIYNAVFGGLIGIVGSIYGFIIRSYVMNNRLYFVNIEKNYRRNPHQQCWRCSNCGRINPSFEDICMCGIKKPDTN